MGQHDGEGADGGADVSRTYGGERNEPMNGAVQGRPRRKTVRSHIEAQPMTRLRAQDRPDSRAAVQRAPFAAGAC